MRLPTHTRLTSDLFTTKEFLNVTLMTVMRVNSVARGSYNSIFNNFFDFNCITFRQIEINTIFMFKEYGKFTLQCHLNLQLYILYSERVTYS